MANYVMNRVIFDTDAEQIKQEIMAIPDGEETDDNGYGTIDFNRIVPMPEELDIDDSSVLSFATRSYLFAACPYTIGAGFEKLSEADFWKLYRGLEEYYGEFDSYDVNKRKEIVEIAFRKAGCEPAKNEYLNFDPQSIDDVVHYGELAGKNWLKHGYFTWYEWRLDKWGTKWNAYDCWKGEPDGLIFSTALHAPHPIVIELSRRYPTVTITHEWADEDYGTNCGRHILLNGMIVDRYCPKRYSKRSIAFAHKVWGDGEE